MKKIFAVAAFAALTMLGTTAAVGAFARPHTGTSTPTGGIPAPQPATETAAEVRRQVSEAQYQILFGQCGYAETQAARRRCREEVAQRYTVGKHDPTLDCRTYSGITVCGELKLSAREQACVRDAVRDGMTHRRAEVECYAFR